MKTVIRLFAVAVLAMAITSSAFAGECCPKAAAAKAAAAAKVGKACEKSTKGEAKPCEKLAPKK